MDLSIITHMTVVRVTVILSKIYYQFHNDIQHYLALPKCS